MRRLTFILALLLLCSCSTYHSAQSGFYMLKCGGPGGEQVFTKCSWRKTSIFALMKHRPVPQPKKEAIRQKRRSSDSK